MRSVLAAESAELLVLHAAGLLLLVLCCGIIPAFALSAFKRYDLSHGNDLHDDRSGTEELATGIEPVTSSLPRKCSTN